jgi:hypothetical protein
MDFMQSSASFLGLESDIWPFSRLFFWAGSDILTICRKVESRLVRSNSEPPAVMFDGVELAQ